MESSALPATSKVTVECTDTSGLFSTFNSLLSIRLPLRSLHWKSPIRPLRSIDTLHVALQPAKYGQKDSSILERRHQIPGLRETPYLKIYLLRCDDRETYKTVCRKEIRDWIKSSGGLSDPKLSSNSQESHDAFEWMIVHVVLPDTPAANQPTTSKYASLGITDSTDSVSSTSKPKWPGKSTSTIYEKLRADFQSTSKSSVERIAQIRIPRDPSNSDASPAVLSPSELEALWQDLIEKLKLLILSSFNQRVIQYEEDIRERESQRSLPGWNFCTFFILKEGLARGFESVGLLEDALIGYDELEAGLESIVREQAAEGDDHHGGAFLPFSKELKGKLRAVLDKKGNSTLSKEDMRAIPIRDETSLRLSKEYYPLSDDKKAYRGLILSNDVSLFDFRTYIFIRQAEILQRATSHFPAMQHLRRPASLRPKRHEDLFYLAEVCRRAMEFVPLAARTLRQELYQAWGGHDKQDRMHKEFQETAIDNIVASWTYCAIMQILEQTESPLLKMTESLTLDRKPGSNDITPKVAPSVEITQPDGGFAGHLGNELQSSEVDPETQDNSWIHSALTSNGATVGGSRNAGAEELASWRAELFMLARRMVENLGSDSQWLPDANDLDIFRGFLPIKREQTNDVSANASNALSTVPNFEESATSLLVAIEPPLLQRAAQSPQLFCMVYEFLTKQASVLFVIAQKFKSAQRALLDTVTLNYHHGRYESVVIQLEDGVHRSLASDQWLLFDGLLLEALAMSFKHLGRTSSYVHAALQLLARYIRNPRSQLRSRGTREYFEGIFDDLFLSSSQLEHPVSASLFEFFEVQNSPSFTKHFDGVDGFYITMSIRSLFGVSFLAQDGVVVSLSPWGDSNGPDLELRTKRQQAIEPGYGTIMLTSNYSIKGWYYLSSIKIEMGKVVFHSQFKHAAVPHTLQQVVSTTRSRGFTDPILIYPAQGSLEARTKAAPSARLSQPRSFQVELKSGWNDILTCSVRLKSRTGGLRLRLHGTTVSKDAENESLTFTNDEKDETDRMSLPAFRPNSLIRLDVPYDLENPSVTVLMAHLEVQYSTESGRYYSISDISINIILPLNVNVQEVFRRNSLYSRFIVSPATLVPIRLEHWNIKESLGYTSESGSGHLTTMDIFPRQPASLLYKFLRRRIAFENESNDAMVLLLTFTCYDEVILSTIQSKFYHELQTSPHARLSRLLVPHLLEKVQSTWSKRDLESACLLQTAELWPYAGMGWEELLQGVPPDWRTDTRRWLREWHTNNATIRLPQQRDDNTLRRLVIPVALPSPQLLISVNLDSRTGGEQDTPVAIGQGVAAALHVGYVKHSQDDRDQDRHNDIEITYEITAPPEIWLIGGQRKGIIQASKLIQMSIPVLLIPQRAGRLLFPSVEVKCFSLDRVETTSTSIRRAEVPCEVNNISQAKSVHVIADVRETSTVWEAQGHGNRNSAIIS